MYEVLPNQTLKWSTNFEYKVLNYDKDIPQYIQVQHIGSGQVNRILSKNVKNLKDLNNVRHTKINKEWIHNESN